MQFVFKARHEEEGFLWEKIKNYLCYSLILGLVVIPEKINK